VQFIQASTRDERQALTEQIVFAWTGQQGEYRNYYQSPIDARRIGALEAFYGYKVDKPNGTGQQYAVMFNEIFTNLVDTVFYQLAARTYLQPFFNEISWVQDEVSGIWLGDFSRVGEKLFSYAEEYPENAQEIFQDFAQAVRGVNPYEPVNVERLSEALIQSLQSESFSAYSGMAIAAVVSAAMNTAISPTSGDDIINGNANNNILFGLGGNDTLNGGDGNDLLDGGVGNDYLVGGKGNDTYLLRKGSGLDTIYDYDTTVGNSDTVQFTDVASTEVSQLLRVGNSLHLHYGDSDRVIVSSYFSSWAYQVERFVFSDGVVWRAADIKALVTTNGGSGNDNISGYNDGENRIFGLDGNDTLTGGALNDLLDGGNGDDSLVGGAGNDTLLGGAGHDRLEGGDGNDLLDGGVGNDYLAGGAGNDTYLLSKGSGLDTIYDYDTTVGNSDTVQFTDVASTEVSQLLRVGNSLHLHYGDSDRVIVSSYFSSWAYQVERFVFSDGVVWRAADIKALVTTNGGSGNDNISGYNDGENRIFGLDGNDTLTGGVLNDLLDGGNGDDSLVGGAGNDILLGGAGNDRLEGGDGDDLLDGGVGNDYLAGGAGNDTYLFDLGGGRDVIYDTGGNDRLLFGSSLTAEQLWFQRNGNNLEILVAGSSDRVTVSNWYGSSSNRIETLQMTDGRTLLDSQVQSLVDAMASFGVPAGGEANLTTDQRAQLDMVVAAHWQ